MNEEPGWACTLRFLVGAAAAAGLAALGVCTCMADSGSELTRSCKGSREDSAFSYPNGHMSLTAPHCLVTYRGGSVPIGQLLS